MPLLKYNFIKYLRVQQLASENSRKKMLSGPIPSLQNILIVNYYYCGDDDNNNDKKIM